jgi:RND family efflux transporter MFP subunit
MTAALAPRVEISAAPGTLIDAYIKELRSTADPVTRTYEVTLGFEPPAGLGVGSGMTARVIVDLPAGDAGRLLVPAVAVVADDEANPRVWIFDAEAGAVTARPVAVGEMSGDLIEILGGLDNGERIAIQGASNLREGMRVRPLGE